MRSLFFAGLFTIVFSNAYANIQALDKIIVVVNDDVITQSELDQTIAEYKIKLRISNLSRDDEDALRKQVLEKMIRTQIQLQKATKLGITVDDVALNRMLENIAEKNKMSLKQLREAVKKEGVSYSRFREQTRDEVIIKQLQQRLVASKINVTDQEILQFIKTNSGDEDSKYHLSHILIATPETATPDDIQAAKKKANQLYERIKKGDDFTEIALRHSNGRNALKGGDLDWRKASELPVIFVQAAKQMKRGEVAKPIRSASGFHILKLHDSSKQKTIVTQTHARHILIRTGADKTDNEAKITLLKLKDQIENGEKFDALAKQYSQDPGSKDSGGDLGWATPGSFVPAFEDAMDRLKIGEISEPFQSQFGWHIIQVLERRNKDKTNDIETARARQIIMKRKIDEELQLWLRRIHDESYIEYKSSASES